MGDAGTPAPPSRVRTRWLAGACPVIGAVVLPIARIVGRVATSVVWRVTARVVRHVARVCIVIGAAGIWVGRHAALTRRPLIVTAGIRLVSLIHAAPVGSIGGGIISPVVS